MTLRTFLKSIPCLAALPLVGKVCEPNLKTFTVTVIDRYKIGEACATLARQQWEFRYREQYAHLAAKWPANMGDTLHGVQSGEGRVE